MRERALRHWLGRLGVRVAHTRATRDGQWLSFACPTARWTHPRGADRHPSAAAIAKDGVSMWTCAGCKGHGSIGELARTLGRLRGDAESMYALAEQVELAEFDDLGQLPEPGSTLADLPPTPLIEEQFEGFWPPAVEAPQALAYLYHRGVDIPTARSLGLLYDEEHGRIRFPVRGRRGELYGWSQRAVGEGRGPKIYDADLPKKWLVLGEERWRRGRPLLLVEGLFGYACLISRGVEGLCDVGALMGSVLTEQKAEKVRAHGGPAYLLLDGDPAGDVGLFGPVRPDGGREWAKGAVARLHGHVPVFVPEWPEGKDDPDQLTREEVARMLAETAPYGLAPPAGLDKKIKG